MKQLRFVLAVAVCGAVLAPALLHAQIGNPFDHLKCYKIKDPQAKTTYTADLVPLQKPPFSVEPGCVISVPAKLFCIPVEKTNVQPIPPGAVNGANAQDYLLYKIKCPNTHVVKGGMPLPVTDQFGARTILVGAHQTLLVPAFKQSNLCHNQAVLGTPPVCGGDCTNPNQKCIVNPAGTDCACEVPCGLNAAGVCGGECQLPGQVCDFATLSNGVVECGCHPFGGGCSADPTTHQCSGLCPTSDETCVTDTAAGTCQCEKPCGATGLRRCGGLCPTASEVCAPAPNDAGCVCISTAPQPCGMNQGQCAGDCPNNEPCLPGGPIPGPGCVCGISQATP